MSNRFGPTTGVTRTAKFVKWTSRLIVCVAVLLFIAGDVKSEAPVVKTLLGDVSGFYMKTRGGRQLMAFTAIPYAIPPVGNLRFKAPMPTKPWEGILDATKTTPICVQRNPYVRQKEIVGQEDCLYLNIYTPVNLESTTEKKLLPVMVFIHGGGWMCGDSTTANYGPELLLDRDVLLVTINYRLGPLGFLSTQDKYCPGNNGLKDQQEALRFIQKTIHSFGGDKDSVTIFGESAGGASVHYHMLSKTSAGLFHKAISESGTALVPWAEAPPGEPLKRAFSLAKFLECPQAPSKEMLNCLRSKDSYDIIDTEYRFYDWDYEPMTPFKAVVEPDLPGAFLTQSPRKLPEVPAVPWMTGINKDEGCLKSVWIIANKTRYNEFWSGFTAIAPVTFYYENSPETKLITKKIRRKYLKKRDDSDTKKGILKLYSHSYFDYPMVQAVEQVFKYTKNPVYLYKLSYKATNSFSQIFGSPDGDHGVCHADELMHLFPIHFLSKPFSAEDIAISEIILTLWTNFATTGNPNKPLKVPFNWKETTSSQKMEYLDIGSVQTMKENLASGSRFWGTLPLWHNVGSHRLNDEL